MTKKSKNLLDYPFVITPLTKEDGGGYLIKFPDLPGCISDGETIEEAIEMGRDALKAWISTAKKMKRSIPKPTKEHEYSGKFIQRLPKSLHAQLAETAKLENISLNSLVLSYIAKGLGETISNTHHD